MMHLGSLQVVLYLGSLQVVLYLASPQVVLHQASLQIANTRTALCIYAVDPDNVHAAVLLIMHDRMCLVEP